MHRVRNNFKQTRKTYMTKVFSDMEVKFFNFLTVEQMQLLRDAVSLEQGRLSLEAVVGARNTQCSLTFAPTLKRKITSNKL